MRPSGPVGLPQSPAGRDGGTLPVRMCGNQIDDSPIARVNSVCKAVTAHPRHGLAKPIALCVAIRL
jgi:hypothetical protein